MYHGSLNHEIIQLGSQKTPCIHAANHPWTLFAVIGKISARTIKIPSVNSTPNKLPAILPIALLALIMLSSFMFFCTDMSSCATLLLRSSNRTLFFNKEGVRFCATKESFSVKNKGSSKALPAYFSITVVGGKITK